MKSLTTSDFWEAYAQLPDKIKEQARKAYQLWQEINFIRLCILRKLAKIFGLPVQVVDIVL
jgi:hypothetical protein